MDILTDITGATRLNNSVYGNPRYRLHTTDGDFLTMSDAGCSYTVDNITGGIHRTGPVMVELGLTRAGRVRTIKVA